jgi:hypothetical protein
LSTALKSRPKRLPATIRREITLHLRLIGPEVGEREEEAAEEARPEVVALGEV